MHRLFDRRRVAAIVVAAAFALLVGRAEASSMIYDDFESGAGNWQTNKGFSVVDIGGNNVLQRKASGGLSFSNNSTPLSAALTIKTLFQADLFGPGPGPANPNDQRSMTLAFHTNSSTLQTNAQQGYQLNYFNGFSNVNGLTLYRKNSNFGPTTTLGSFQIDDFDLDNAVHELMITDDGTGMIDVYWDGDLVISVDDSANYLGADGQHVGIWSSSNAEMTPYIDNFSVTDYIAPVVPEPASIAAWLVMILGLGVAVGRSRILNLGS